MKLHLRLELIRHRTAPPALNQSDPRLKNVILNDQANIVASLDWENCASNIAPQWELSIALPDLTMDEKYTGECPGRNTRGRVLLPEATA